MIEQAYRIAKDQYAAMGIDTDAAMEKLKTIPVSMHCWQGDDVGGFEQVGGAELSGGIQATGNYPGKAQTIDQLRGDLPWRHMHQFGKGGFRYLADKGVNANSLMGPAIDPASGYNAAWGIRAKLVRS